MVSPDGLSGSKIIVSSLPREAKLYCLLCHGKQTHAPAARTTHLLRIGSHERRTYPTPLKNIRWVRRRLG